MSTKCIEERKKSYLNYAKMRDARKMRDSDVAKATEIPASTFTEWKKGKSAPKIEKIIKIATLFEVPLDDFVRIMA